MQPKEKLPDQSWQAVTQTASPAQVEQYLIDEIFKAMGLGAYSQWRKWFGPVFSPVVSRFAQLGAGFDQSVAQNGFIQTARTWLQKWAIAPRLQGQENLPVEGPLLIAANHPGTYDGLSVAASLPREDLKIVVSGLPFFRSLPSTREYFVYSTREMSVRVATIRAALRHLLDGGALLIFPSGNLEPDPAYFPQAARQALQRWSASLEMFLRKVPETKLVVAINAGFIAPEYLRHPLTHLRRSDEARQKLAEFLQVIWQVILNHPTLHQPGVFFTPPATLAQLSGAAGGIPAEISAMAQRLLEQVSPGDPAGAALTGGD
ncbi:MAG: 1-acyl-sn-glycerol-3-phosphate acyltransferase [Anaerolineales bacterium]|nr:1-acyl-sn-glycerol-3-phosphate acyltransferase [Anaerolineales bacterium]